MLLKILIVDDHAVVRSGLRQFLSNIPDYLLAGEASNGREALDFVKKEHWDLLILDIGLPDLNGLEVLKRVKEEKPALPVLIFSMFAEDEQAIAAYEAGAAGYLQKDAPPEEILDAIRRTGRGERYLSPQFSEKLLAGTTTGKRELHESLSARELIVMRLLSRGMALTDIGESLHLSPKTVSTYRARILVKLNLTKNAELTRYVIQHKLDSE